ncbi:MAG: hypothetical protein Q9164_002659 [Protoblastenia rupestris]
MKNGFVTGMVLDGRYESISPLNHGSFGMVFLAKDRTSGDLVAVKCLSKSPSATDCAAVDVEENSVELTWHDRLGKHPNIVNLLHSFETKAHIYLVLEYCSMGDLYEAIRLGRGPLETENVREFMLQLINAVEHMHSKGLYHRDIKPENIFLSHDGSMKLGDLGLATSDPWSYEASVGSDRYMAPEQYDPTDSGYAPAKADTWAIGICLLNVLFSRNPFVTPTEADVLFADFARDNKSLFDIFPNMSEDTFNVLLSAISLDPAKRSLSAVREALEKVVNFTTDDDVLDDFCTEAREAAPASANREPLRTPSVSSSQIDQNGAFPWAKVLHMPPHNGRQLSAIADTESYSEDLFTASEYDRRSWVSWAQNSSVTSGLDSAFSASVKSMIFKSPTPRSVARSKPVPVPNSMPSRISTLSHIFSRKGNSVSKSWTDIYDEDEEESQHVASLNERREENSRTWSHDSEAKTTVQHPGLSNVNNYDRNIRILNSDKTQSRLSMDSSSEVFSFEESTRNASPKRPMESSLSKRIILDKWAALGNRRRQYKQVEDTVVDDNRKRTLTGNWRTGFGLKVFSAGHGGSDKGAKRDVANTKVLDWRMNTRAPQRQSVEDLGWDIEWVGGHH